MEACPLCIRDIHFKSDHHLTPKCRGGKEKVLICRDCHEAIHALFSNKELEHEFNSVDSLLKSERFTKTIKFISKQDPSRRTKTKLASDQRKRNRNG